MDTYIVSYDEFMQRQQKVDEGLAANIALGVLTTLASIGGAYAQGKEAKTSVQHTKTQSEQKAVQLQNNGWQLDGTKMDTIWKKAPKAEVIVNEFELDLSQGFESGRFVLNDASKKAIDSTFADLQESGQIVTKIAIESSTDKTPISQRMQKETGIKNNEDLSKARNESIIKYLKEQDLVTNDNAKDIEQCLLSEQGTKDDPSARYVKLKVYSINIENVEAKAESEEVTTYYLSKENKLKSPKKIKHGTSKLKRSKKVNNFKNYMEAVKCPVGQK